MRQLFGSHKVLAKPSRSFICRNYLLFSVEEDSPTFCYRSTAPVSSRPSDCLDHTQLDTHAVRILWMSDQLVTEAAKYTVQNTTDEHPNDKYVCGYSMRGATSLNKFPIFFSKLTSFSLPLVYRSFRGTEGYRCSNFCSLFRISSYVKRISHFLKHYHPLWSLEFNKANQPLPSACTEPG